jgi:hypothetical protein
LIGGILGKGNALVAVDIGGAGDLQPHWSTLNGNARFLVNDSHWEYSEKVLSSRDLDEWMRQGW